jgi:hypothetical protein
MTTYTDQPANVIRIDQGASPRWLQIARDAVWTVVGILIIIGAGVAVASMLWLGNAVSDLGTTTDPAPTTQACTDPDVPWCTPTGG